MSIKPKATVKPGQGRKDDDGKLRYDLIPPEALEAMARVLTYGAVNYGERNWEEGLEKWRTFAASQRHLWADWAGEDIDDPLKGGSGLPHLEHALVNLAFMVTFRARGMYEEGK